MRFRDALAALMIALLLAMACTHCACTEYELHAVDEQPQTSWAEERIPAPDIYASPASGPFDPVQVASVATLTFAIGNKGSDPLHVGTVTIAGPGARGPFALVDDQVSHRVLAPGTPPRTLTVAFQPWREGEAAAEVWIATEDPGADPDENPLVIPLTGMGWAPGGEGPVAVCGVAPALVHPPFEPATFLGQGSHDPDGHDLVAHRWTLLERPDGSSAALPEPCDTPDCGPFVPDLVGSYTAELTIENEVGFTDTCTVELQAVPDEGLWVELSWTHDHDDMDLHLLAPGGTPRTDTDCHYGNCVGPYAELDWGVPGDPDDDPHLDLDDIPGTGPENVNIAAPAPGVYTVFVHDYPHTGIYSGINATTVRVYVHGLLAFTDTRNIAGEDADIYFAEVAWPSGVVTGM